LVDYVEIEKAGCRDWPQETGLSVGGSERALVIAEFRAATAATGAAIGGSSRLAAPQNGRAGCHLCSVGGAFGGSFSAAGSDM